MAGHVIEPRPKFSSTHDDRAFIARGACREEDPELFFPIGDTGPAALQIEEAKAVCNLRCPVREECLRWALDTRQMDGVWGGASEKERARALRARQPGRLRPRPAGRRTNAISGVAPSIDTGTGAGAVAA